MGFGNLKSDAGLASLNGYLQDRSYIEGFVPSQADVAVFNCLAGAPAARLNHALRWFNQISSYSAQERKAFPGVQKPVEQYGSSSATNGPASDAAEKDEDDDFDLFGDDVEAPEPEPAKVEVKKKKQVIAKSSLVLDVKPWDDETDMAEMERLVRTIEADGLLWGASKLVPLAYGIRKLQISCVIEDEKISTDFLEEQICGFEDHVQSMDIAAFNKI